MKKLLAVLICGIMAATLCGCNIFIFDTDNLLSPPEPTGELKLIQKALVESIDGDYTLKYPTSGDIKSAVVTEDINGDGENEAFAFYSTDDKEQTTMHLNVLVKDKKGYKSVDDSEITASGIEQIDFFDLNGDGTEEIVIGWEIYAESEKQLSVYNFEKNVLTSLMLQKYTNYMCIDFDDDGKNEILVQELDTKKGENKARVYSLDKKGLTQTAGCSLDAKVKNADKFKLSALTNGKKAVYIDEIKGIGAVTEVLYMSNGELKNPLLDSENTMENVITVRASTIASADINGDGIIEIPMASVMPCVGTKSGEKVYYTNWCSFDGKSLAVEQVSLVNSADGYSINIPKRFIGNIAVSKNVDKRTRTIYRYNSDTKKTGRKIATVKAFDKDSYDKSKEKSSYVFSKDNTVVIVDAYSIKGDMKLTKQELKTLINFNDF